MLKKIFISLAAVFVLSVAVIPPPMTAHAVIDDLDDYADYFYDDDGKLQVPNGKELSELFGEITFNLLAIDVREYTPAERDELEKTIGGRVMSHLNKRAVGYNSIIGSFIDGDIERTWSELVHWLLLPGEAPPDPDDVPDGLTYVPDGLSITITDELLSAIAEALKDLPETVNVSTDFALLTTRTGPRASSTRAFFIDKDEIPFNFDLLDYDSLHMRIVVDSPVYFDTRAGHSFRVYRRIDDSPWDGYMEPNYMMHNGKPADDPPVEPFTDATFVFDLTEYHDYDKAVLETIRIGLTDNRLDHQPDEYSYSIYYKFYGDGADRSIPFGDVINNNDMSKNFTEMTTNEIYNHLDRSYHDNTTIVHEIHNDYYSGDYDGFDDKYDIPPHLSGDSGTGGLLSTILDLIGSLLGGILDSITSLPGKLVDLLGSLADILLGLIEPIVRLLIPSSEQIAEMGDSVGVLRDTFTDKFSGVFDITTSLTGLFASDNVDSAETPLFDDGFAIETPYGSMDIPFLVDGVAPALSKLRLLLSGGFALMTFVAIYKRFVGTGDVIQ